MLQTQGARTRIAFRKHNAKSFSCYPSPLSRRTFKPLLPEDPYRQASNNTPKNFTNALRKHIPYYGVSDDELNEKQLKNRADEVRRLHDVREDFAKAAKLKGVTCSDEALEQMADMYMEGYDSSAKEMKKKSDKDGRLRALKEEFATTARLKGVECSEEDLDEMVDKFMSVEKFYRAALIVVVGGVVYLLWSWLGPYSRPKSKAEDKKVEGIGSL